MTEWLDASDGHSSEVGANRECLPAISGIRRRGMDVNRNAVFVPGKSVLPAMYPTVSEALASSLAAAESTAHYAVDDRHLSFEDTRPIVPSDDVHVEIIPRLGLASSPKSSMSIAARSIKFEWHVLPPAGCLQHLPDGFDLGLVRTRGLQPSRPTDSSSRRRCAGSAKSSSGIQSPVILAHSMSRRTVTSPRVNSYRTRFCQGLLLTGQSSSPRVCMRWAKPKSAPRDRSAASGTSPRRRFFVHVSRTFK